MSPELAVRWFQIRDCDWRHQKVPFHMLDVKSRSYIKNKQFRQARKISFEVTSKECGSIHVLAKTQVSTHPFSCRPIWK